MNKNNFIAFALICLAVLLFSCNSTVKKNSLSPEQQAEFLSKGVTISQQSFAALSAELMKALLEGGVQHAAGYCHLQANPLTDSLSHVYEASIMRVSDKNRNPYNKPDLLDLTVINAYRDQLAQGQELKPHLEMTANEVVFYSPILIMNPLCLQCHGVQGLNMEQETLAFIKARYPDDLATGYKLGELRGVWKIKF